MDDDLTIRVSDDLTVQIDRDAWLVIVHSECCTHIPGELLAGTAAVCPGELGELIRALEAARAALLDKLQPVEGEAT